MTSPRGTRSFTLEAQQRTRSVPLYIAALAVALAGTIFCGYVIYKTTKVPVGDGSGMQ
jgi:hypothetical protein